MSRSGSDAADKPGEMTPAPSADLPERPDTDVFVVRAASAPRACLVPALQFRFPFPRHDGGDSWPLLLPGRGCPGRRWAAAARPSESG